MASKTAVLSAEQVVGRLKGADILGQAGPDDLLAGAVGASVPSPAHVRAELAARYDMPPKRAAGAVGRSRRLMRGLAASDPLGMLSGTPQPKTQNSFVRALLQASGADAAAASSKISYSAVRAAWRAERVDRVASAAARSRDLPSMVVAAALLASMRYLEEGDLGAALAGALTLPALPADQVQDVVDAGSRVLLSAYAMDARRAVGLDLGGGNFWNEAPAGWRATIAPWLLPVIEPGQSPAVTQLLSAMRRRNLSALPPDRGLGDHKPHHDDVLATARDMAAAAEPGMTIWFDRPMWFDGGAGERQVLLTQDDEYAYAWVGQNGVGVLVSFDTLTYTGYGLDHPLTVPALAEAVAWYVDVSVSLRRTPAGSVTVKRTSSGAAAGGYRYVPQASYVKQRSDVASGASTPPRSHLVAAFVRHLSEGQNPSPAHVALAPPRLRKKMGLQDTFVRSHQRGKGLVAIDWTARLGKASALADIHGLLDRGK